jgi:RHS repeat-associated protein
LLYEVNLNNNVATKHLYLGRNKLADIENGNVTYYHSDPVSSPLAATDASGNLLWRTSYRPYGERLTGGDGGKNKEWFGGKPYEDVTGLSYFGARWYDPVLGRFAAIDPVDWSEANPVHSFNRYGYANNNPYKFVDPDGRNAVVNQVARVEVVGNSARARAMERGPRGGSGKTGAVEQSFLQKATYQQSEFSIDIFKIDFIVTPQLFPIQMLKRASQILADNIESSRGEEKESGQDSHHIVAFKDKRAESSRAILESVGMDINDAFNGINLDRKAHQKIHTTAYHEAVNGLLVGTSSYAEAAVKLTAIRGMIIIGTFPR